MYYETFNVCIFPFDGKMQTLKQGLLGLNILLNVTIIYLNWVLSGLLNTEKIKIVFLFLFLTA